MASYKNIEEPLKLINKKYVSLDTEQVKYNNKRLGSTLLDLIEIMKEQDTLFEKLFDRPYFGGSYYDDLKVGKPDEFDLDLLLTLPKECETHTIESCDCVKVSPSNKPGFFWFRVGKGFCAELNKFIKDGYVQTNLILNWMKSNVAKALNKLKKSDVYSSSLTYSSESGPAIIIQLNGIFGHMDVDLVPAFEFGPEHWPQARYRLNTTTRTDFFVVPKQPKGERYGERYWRASFQDQERELIKGKERLKPALRLLKKMRNNLVQSKISSYALKTIVLSEINTSYFNWSDTLGDTFVKLLEKYKDALFKQNIPYFWNGGNNLLDGINPATLLNHHNEISILLKKIKDQHATNPCIVGKVILKDGTAECREFLAEYQQQTDGGNGLTVRSSSHGSSYYTFDPSSSAGDSPFSTGAIESNESGGASQLTRGSSTSGWVIAGGVALIGAAVGLGILRAVNNNNRNQNR